MMGKDKNSRELALIGGAHPPRCPQCQSENLVGPDEADDMVCLNCSHNFDLDEAEGEELALIGASEVAGYWPEILANAGGAQALADAMVRVAFNKLQDERMGGSEYPPVITSVVDPDTGEIRETANLAFKALVYERTLLYLQNLGLEAQGAILLTVSRIFKDQLYLHHPDQWGSLSLFLRSMAEEKSPSYKAIVEDLVTVVIPFLDEREVFPIESMVSVVTKGGWSNLYFLRGKLLKAIEDGNQDKVRAMLEDTTTMQREDLFIKWDIGKKPDPARARLSRTVTLHGFGYTRVLNPYQMAGPAGPPNTVMWRLVIEMKPSQKAVILNRLGTRVEYE